MGRMGRMGRIGAMIRLLLNSARQVRDARLFMVWVVGGRFHRVGIRGSRGSIGMGRNRWEGGGGEGGRSRGRVRAACCVLRVAYPLTSDFGSRILNSRWPMRVHGERVVDSL